MSFDWQTDDASARPTGLITKERKRVHIRLPWRWLAAGIVLLIVAYVAYRNLRERAFEAVDSFEDNVLASHVLIQDAAKRGDVELFATFLSGRDPAWSEVQEGMVRKQQFHNLDRFGFLQLNTSGAMEEARVILDPTFSSAEVIWRQRYAIEIGRGLSETVTLEHTAVFRPGPDRWLLAPPEDEFWGERLVNEGRYLNMGFPSRDEEIGRRLSLDLDEKLGEMCARIEDLNCPEDLNVKVDLVTDVAALAEMQDSDWAMDEGNRLFLPAPSLVGMPLNEQAYRALYRGYASQIVTATITRLVGWRCCEAQILVNALLAKQMGQLGLRPVQVAYDDYQLLLDERVMLSDLAQWWDGEGEKSAQEDYLYSTYLAEFIESGLHVTPAKAQRVLGRMESSAFWDVMTLLSGRRVTEIREFERIWGTFVYDHSTLGMVRPTLLFPDQELTLMCRPDGQDTLSLIRYDVPVDGLRIEHRLPYEQAFLLGLPDDEGIIVSADGIHAGNASSLSILEHGTKTNLSWTRSAAAPAAQPILTDPSGRLLLLGTVVDSAGLNGLLQLAGCRDPEGVCGLETILGYPVWSPDGTRAVLISGSEWSTDDRRAPAMLSIADGNGVRERMIRTGSSPFWLDLDTYGYVIDEGGERGQVVITTDIMDQEPEPLLDATDLTTALPELEIDEPLFIDYVGVSSAFPQQIFLVTAGTSNTDDYLLSYDIEANAILTHTAIVDGAVPYERGYRFSPDGRWLLISNSSGDEDHHQMIAHDVMENQTRAYNLRGNSDVPITWGVDWSANGRWFILVESGIVRLIAPEQGYERWVVPDDLDCTAAVWINKE